MDPMDMQCKKCSTDIDMMKSLFTVCEGRCAKKFHASCVSVSEADLCALSKNIIWICDDCMVEYCKARDRLYVSESDHTGPAEPNSFVAELAEVKTQIEAINNTIAKLSVAATQPASIQRHSTPVTSPKSLSSASVAVSDCSTRRSHQSEDSFSLLLTNIDRRVTENEIVCLVSESLCAAEPECMDVTKLVPSWKNCDDLDFISFKVVLHKRRRQLASASTTWPRGVKFREFAHRNNDTWKSSNLRSETM